MNTRTITRRLITALIFTAAATATAADTAPPRLKRAGAFLGVHFDFHAGMDCTNVGARTTPAMIENIITLVHPDYLQIDCKGHPGLSSYPTKVGHQAPGIIGDPLRVWREVTARHGVSLYMHYSGVWDSKALKEHPDWAALKADGNPNGNANSVFGPYADKLLIPQLRELAGVYGVDGAWVDGECWAAIPDYSEAALEAWRKTSGNREAPRKPADPNWFELLQFNREAFRQYLRYYIAAVKKTNPNFELCSNWAYTDHMAEPVNSPVDFISGDYSPEDSVNSARLSARYLVRQGKPWDLMAWSFARKAGKGGASQKSAIQLKREAAVVLALGGGFQAYFKQKRDGSVFDEQMPVMAEVARFCRARQAICHRAEPVPQVAVLLSTAGHYRKINGLFNRDLGRISGTLQALLENQHPVDVVGEHQLAGHLPEYPVIVVPEWEYLEPAFKGDLVNYVKGGGSLLLVGTKTAALFPVELGVTLGGETNLPPRQLVHQGTSVAVKGGASMLILAAGTRPFGQLTAQDMKSQPAASIRALGRGKIAAIYFNLGQTYLGVRQETVRQFASDLVRELFPSPLVEVKGSGVDVSLARNRGRLLVNLVNTSGPHQTEPIFDTIPPAGPLEVTVRLNRKPVAITLEPGAQPLAYDYRNGQVRLQLPKVELHDIIVIQPN